MDKYLFLYNSNFNIIDENNEGYIIRLGDEYSGAVIAVAKFSSNNISLLDLKTITENDLISKGIILFII